MNDIIVNIMGYSGQGKDTIAKLLSILSDEYHLMKFARPIKSEVEARYNLPPGILEHRSVKNAPCSDGVFKTYSDILVDSYHALIDMHPSYKLAYIPRHIEWCHRFGLTPVFTDCRNLCEGELLKRYQVFNVWVLGRKSQPLSSDKLQQTIFNVLSSCDNNDTAYVCNNEGLRQLLAMVDILHSKIQAYRCRS